MINDIDLTDLELDVLASWPPDTYLNYHGLQNRTDMDVKQLKPIVKKLKEKGYIQLDRGLFTEDVEAWVGWVRTYEGDQILRSFRQSIEERILCDYEQLPSKVKAAQLTTTNITKIERMIEDSGQFAMKLSNYKGLQIGTSGGVIFADFGDWIIKGADGSYYKVKDDVFAKNYKLIN